MAHSDGACSCWGSLGKRQSDFLADHVSNAFAHGVAESVMFDDANQLCYLDEISNCVANIVKHRYAVTESIVNILSTEQPVSDFV